MTRREITAALGRRGGLKRAQRLPAARKIEIAALGAAARARSLQIARRITVNFEYVSAVRTLQRGAGTIATHQQFNGRLPGIYLAKD